MKKIISIILALVSACSALSSAVLASNIQGDVNDSGDVSAVDARLILRYVAGLDTPENTDAYDVNDDGNISAVDARIVLQFVAGLREPEVDDNGGDKPVTPPADDNKPEIPATKEEMLKGFVAAMNSVKTDASSATLVSMEMYECEKPVVSTVFSVLISEEDIAEMTKDSYGKEESNKTYTGEDIDAAFPPTGTTCNLTMNDIKSISVKEGLTTYTYVVVVKGEKNPTRGKGVGAVATVVTQEDLQASIEEDEDLKGLVTMDAIYKDVTVKAEVDKETGKIIRYTADAPLVMSTNMAGQFAFSVGLGVIENWTIAY